MHSLNLRSLREPLTWLKVVTGILLIVIVLRRLSTTVADPDLWGFLAFGKLFWSTGQFPYRDVFSYLPTLDPWVYHEWLTSVLFYPLYQHLGAPGLQIFKYLIALATFLFLYLTARKRGANLFGFALVFFIALRGWIYFGYSPVRAQVFTYFFFALTLYLLESGRLKNRWGGLWLIVLIQAFWSNLHGGFLAGIGLISLYVLGEFISRRSFLPYLVILILSAMAILINPYGLEYYAYIVRAISMPRPEIWEWYSIRAAFIAGIISWKEILSIVCMVIFGLILMWRNHWKDITASLTLCLTLYLGLRHIRHLVFFYLLMAVYLPGLLTYYWEDLKSKPGFMSVLRSLGIRVPVLVASILTLFIAFSFVKRSPLTIEIPSQPGKEFYYPVGAVTYIQKHRLSGKLLTEFGWGEYLIWNLYPQCKVGLDGRYETVYPEEVVKKYFDFLYLRSDYRQFLSDYPPDMILVSIKSLLYDSLKIDHQWQEAFADSGCALFIGKNFKSLVREKSP